MRNALVIALGLAFAATEAAAAGLGRLTVQSALGQPLRAEVEITSITSEETGNLNVRLASQQAYRATNLEYNPALVGLRFAIDRRGQATVVRVSSSGPINEPFLELLIELNTPTGRVLREYTVLLDPPALRAAPEVVAPTAPARAAAPAPAAAAPAPAPAPAPAAAAPAPRAPATAAAPSGAAAGEYVVKQGDTLGKIAAQAKPPAVSLDQMLVALLRANPSAFIEGNMNRLIAGSRLSVPSEQQAQSLSNADARREVLAQSQDFNQYRNRLAQAATGVPQAPAAAAGQGAVAPKVEDRSSAARTGDQLKIAKGEAAVAAKAQDEAVAKQRALKEQEERAAALKKANEQIKQALELQSKAGAQAQKAAEAKAPEAGTPTPAPVAAAPTPAPAATAPTPAPAPAPAEPPKGEAPKAAPPAPAAPAKAAPAPAESPSFLSSLFSDGNTGLALGGLAAVLVALLGLNLWRRRRADQTAEFGSTQGMRANSLFGATGGQSVDTAASSFNSSFIPAASQLDSNEVDPVAEADVYIAYGREEQAEDILKEALRAQPDRHPVRVKLLEIYSRRGDKAAFNGLAQDMHARTHGVGEDWERAAKLGRQVDAGNPMYAGGGDTVMRGPATELRLDPATKGGRPATLTGGATVMQPPAPASAAAAGGVAGTIPSMDLSAPTQMPRDTRLPQGVADDEAATVSFEATRPLEDIPMAPLEIKKPEAATPPAQHLGIEFDLGGVTPPTVGATTVMPPAAPSFDFKLDDASGPATVKPAFKPTEDLATTLSGIDLNLPKSPAPAEDNGPATRPGGRPTMDEALSRPTLLGELGALPTDQSPRLTSNTDQATVPLIDFDLTGTDVDFGGRKTETPVGSPLAAQMATKLDLARGYIDLGVKDGARELLEEVMRDGTREQRQQAVELLKQVDV